MNVYYKEFWCGRYKVLKNAIGKISWIGSLPYMQTVSRGKIILNNKEFIEYNKPAWENGLNYTV